MRKKTRKRMPKTYTYFEVRTPGYEDSVFFTEPVVALDGRVNYDQQDLASAKAYAKTLHDGYVVKVTVEKV
jgi:hypothetical protein